VTGNFAAKNKQKIRKKKKFRKFVKIRLRNRNLHDGPSEGGGGSEVVVVKGRIRETQPTRLWANHQVIHHPFLLAAPSHGCNNLCVIYSKIEFTINITHITGIHIFLF
jgi:hypothetical protein